MLFRTADVGSTTEPVPDVLPKSEDVNDVDATLVLSLLDTLKSIIYSTEIKERKLRSFSEIKKENTAKAHKLQKDSQQFEKKGHL